MERINRSKSGNDPITTTSFETKNLSTKSGTISGIIQKHGEKTKIISCNKTIHPTGYPAGDVDVRRNYGKNWQWYISRYILFARCKMQTSQTISKRSKPSGAIAQRISIRRHRSIDTKSGWFRSCSRKIGLGNIFTWAIRIYRRLHGWWAGATANAGKRRVVMYLLDTNTCIFIKNKKPSHVLERLHEALDERICMSSITVAELQFGVYNSQNIEKNRIS